MQRNWLFWLPRILSIIVFLFIFLTSFDVFEEGKSVSDILIAFLIHNIPAFILLILIILAWKMEIIGAITFFTLGILHVLFTIFGVFKSDTVEWYNAIVWLLIVSGPAFLIASLYLKGWKNKHNKG
ncbi:DUF7670 domain-containing protein [Fervidobacterium sp.]